ncbi:MAG: trimethylamine methyltransferase family protein [Dehalococcoidales bacterium]|nr:MAG: trimethylamine methyltransferase family protein [Dehalococcoidales bacterium]
MTRRGIAGGSYKPLSDDAIDRIHQTVLKVIEEVGFQVNSQEALRYFKEAGAIAGDSENVIRMSSSKVMDLLGMAPSEVCLCGQDEKNDVILGGNRVYAGTGGTALYVYEPDTDNKRLANLDDLKKIAKLVDHLDNIHIYMLPTYPSELPVEQIDVNRFYAGLSNSSKHIMGGIYTIEGVQQVIKMAEIIAGSEEALRQRPLVSMIACVMSPLKMDAHYGDLLITIAKKGVPVVCPSEPLCGATSPVTLAGNLVVQTVDSLMGVVLSQIVNPGTPAIFGSVATNTDLRDLRYLAGSVEMGLLNAAGAQMAQFYKLPFYATGGMTDSKVLDSQSGYESAVTTLLCGLAGANFIHDSAGLMEFAMTVSYEKFVIDNEIIGMMMRAVEGIKVDDDTLAFDIISQVGPGGNFVTSKHTRKYMRSEHYQPLLSDRESREDWASKGKPLTWERAAEIVQQVGEGEGYNLPDDIEKKVLAEIPGITG